MIATEEWIKERWGGFTYLDISRNEDFSLQFVERRLWLHFEQGRSVGCLLLLYEPTQADVLAAEIMFGCRDK